MTRAAYRASLKPKDSVWRNLLAILLAFGEIALVLSAFVAVGLAIAWPVRKWKAAQEEKETAAWRKMTNSPAYQNWKRIRNDSWSRVAAAEAQLDLALQADREVSRTNRFSRP